MAKKIILWLAVIGMSAVIFGFSSGTGEQSAGLSEKIAKSITSNIEKIIEADAAQRKNIFEITHVIVRKSAHFLEFAVLGILCFLLVKSYGCSLRICLITALSYCLIFAVCDEVHQLFVDGRAGKFTDVCIDFAGSFAGVMLIKIGYCRKNHKKAQY